MSVMLLDLDTNIQTWSCVIFIFHTHMYVHIYAHTQREGDRVDDSVIHAAYLETVLSAADAREIALVLSLCDATRGRHSISMKHTNAHRATTGQRAVEANLFVRRHLSIVVIPYGTGKLNSNDNCVR